MSNVEVRRNRVRLACLALVAAAVALIAPAAAQAEDTVWICKPGQADDLCAGTIDGVSNPAPGQAAEPLPYKRPADAPVDCFYLYPTQSEQATPNANLDKDPPIRRVVVQQARMFSSVCDVYAPMYHQVTYNGNQGSYNQDVETAYQSAKAGFEDYLKNYNDGRGFIMIGHSQGAAHTARLIDDMVDKDPDLRKRFVGAIAPGANISVPIGQPVGGLFDNVPACTEVGEFGCVTAYSTFNDVPGPTAPFSRLDFGYWIYPEARPDSSKYEAMCVNPALIDGGDGTLLPLVNLDYLLDVPSGPEGDAPWLSQPDYYKVECKSQDGAHWLNLTKTDLPGDSRPDIGALVASGSNYHVPEVNLAEGNLLTIAQKQADAYLDVRSQIDKLQGKLDRSKKKKAKLKKKVARLKDRLDDAGHRKAKALKRKIKRTRKKAKGQKVKIASLRERISELESKLL